MEEYIVTIIWGVLTVLFISFTLFCYLHEKDKKEYDGWMPHLAFITYPIFIFLFVVFCSLEHREVKYPYDLEYTCKLYYYDGGSEVKTFTCRGYHYPQIVNRHGGFAFSCGFNEINAVTRFEVLNKKKIDKKD